MEFPSWKQSKKGLSGICDVSVIANCPKTCLCGQPNDHDHTQICKKGKFISVRHNTIRDTAAHFLEKVCHGVKTEPPLLNVGTRQLQPGTNVSDGARLDISASLAAREGFGQRWTKHSSISGYYTQARRPTRPEPSRRCMSGTNVRRRGPMVAEF